MAINRQYETKRNRHRKRERETPLVLGSKSKKFSLSTYDDKFEGEQSREKVNKTLDDFPRV